MKATHDGNCQLCGRLQRLPSGSMAKHGYTVEWGFFSGQCPGSGHLPFQQSKDLIEGAIAHQLVCIEDSKAEAAKLRDPASDENTGATCWVNEYRGCTRGLGSYVWRKVVITKTAHTSDGFTYFTYDYVNNEGRAKRLDYLPFEIKDDLKAVVMHKNNERAERVFDKDAAERTKYVGWLKLRARDWSVQPLIVRQ